MFTTNCDSCGEATSLFYDLVIWRMKNVKDVDEKTGTYQLCPKCFEKVIETIGGVEK